MIAQAVVIDRGGQSRSASSCTRSGAVVGLLILAVFGVGLGALSYALALAVEEQDWMFWVVQQTLLFPLLLLAGMLLPLEGGPGWLQALAQAQPADLRRRRRARAVRRRDRSTPPSWAAPSPPPWSAVLGLTVGTRAMSRSS